MATRPASPRRFPTILATRKRGRYNAKATSTYGGRAIVEWQYSVATNGWELSSPSSRVNSDYLADGALVELSPRGTVPVDGRLNVAGYQNVYALGDIARAATFLLRDLRRDSTRTSRSGRFLGASLDNLVHGAYDKTV